MDQPKKLSNGHYLILALFLNFVFKNINIHMGSAENSAFISALLHGVLGLIAVYFLVLWIMDLIRRRGKVERPKSKRAKIIVNVIFIILLLMIVTNLITARSKVSTPENNAAEISNKTVTPPVEEMSQEIITPQKDTSFWGNN